MPNHDATEFPEATYKEATEGWQQCQAENARLQTALEEVRQQRSEYQSWLRSTERERDGYKARDRLRGDELKEQAAFLERMMSLHASQGWHRLNQCTEHGRGCNKCSPLSTEYYATLGLKARVAAAIDIKPEAAREKEGKE